MHQLRQRLYNKKASAKIADAFLQKLNNFYKKVRRLSIIYEFDGPSYL